MCGIVGAFGPPGLRHSWLEMACKALRHRGPDDAGVWREPAAGVGLGHTRLAIQDLSDAGRQPMSSACARYQIVFNGEIYNHLELRRALPALAWRGHSDTETVLACLAEWGTERALRAIVGMFAFAAFDSLERRLILARDRLGEKPLYYGYAGDSLVFASELKPLCTVPGFDSAIDRSALALYMRHGYVPAPCSIHSSLRKLQAGSWIELTSETVSARSLPEPRVYWSAISAAVAGERNSLNVDDSEAVNMLELVMRDAVRGQMLSDVPLGAFLSGGIDSSTIVALMQAQSTKPVRTFSIGFEEAEYDESSQARLVAQHLGTAHTELVVRADDALALVPRMPAVYDEPFADSSQLPTLLVAQLAKRHVTVALSGDGGDELFAGYNRYFLGARAWPRISHVPRPLRRGVAQGLRMLSPQTWDCLAAAMRPITPSRYQVRMAGDKLHKVADVLASSDGQELYRRLVSQWWLEPLVLDAGGPTPAPEGQWAAVSALTHRMMLLDTITYLPDDILVKVDRAAMSVSLETRVPMLDHRVFEFAWRLPLRMKVRDGLGKWILRQLLYRYVPRHLVERPKMGFAVPLDAWLRGPLREWAEHLLAESRLRLEGFLDAQIVRRRWQEHLAGQRNWQYQLWNVLMFEAWLEARRCGS
jgi:asparagine synthase (glutamine-hydrolysing)